jgi:hypothetical protein
MTAVKMGYDFRHLICLSLARDAAGAVLFCNIMKEAGGFPPAASKE